MSDPCLLMGGNMSETAFDIECQGARLPAILHEASGQHAVVVVVGGPQYRVGSHRQFVLLARALAAQGFPVLRFDMRGMGDQTGPIADFEAHEPDLLAAISALHSRMPQVQRVTLWGLCDGATLAAMVANRHPLIRQLILLNPWVRTAHTEAQARLRHYYLQRLFDKAFWRRLMSGEVALWSSLSGLLRQCWTLVLHRIAPPKTGATQASDFVTRMLRGLEQFPGKVGFIVCDQDLTAQEFMALCQSESSWQAMLNRHSVRRHQEANHTFSSARWRHQVELWTLEFLHAADS